MDNMTGFIGDKVNNGRLPDIDWLDLNIGDTPNNPTQNNVQVIPELQEQWSNKVDKGISLSPNTVSVVKPIKVAFSNEDIEGVIRTAKIAAMQGMTKSKMASYLNNTYPQELIVASKEGLVKVAEEQGLLGNVYVDLSAFNSCKEAAHKLGSNRIRSAKYVTGHCKGVCSSHHTGYCHELKKTVVGSIDYTPELLGSYENHLKLVGKLASDETITTKDALKEALLKSDAIKPSNKAGDTTFTDSKSSVSTNMAKTFNNELRKKEASIKASQVEDRFEQARPIMAFIQENMLKGKMGDSLKEIIASNFSNETIAKFSHEIDKVVSLQGLLGNVYVDVSYYKNANDAINSIRSASTSPQYLVQSITPKSFDNTINIVATATGCDILPKNGKIDSKIAHSYIDDIIFSDKIASEDGASFKSAIEAGENVLGIIREAFIATLSHKKQPKYAGYQATLTSKGERKESIDMGKLKEASHKSITSGLPLEDLEEKLSSYVSSIEASNLVNSVLSSLKEINSSVLKNCTTRKYALHSSTKIVPSEKCAGCVLNNNGSNCLKTKLAFKTEKAKGVIASSNIKDDYEVTGNEGFNISLGSVATLTDNNIDNSYTNSGIDEVMGSI